MDDASNLPPEADHDISLFDESDPKSLVNIVWGGLRESIKNWDHTNDYMWGLTDWELTKTLKPDATLILIRIRFWEEVQNAIRKNKKISQYSVTHGIVTREYWHQQIQKNPYKMVYVLTPPLKYRTRSRALLDIGLDRLGRILSVESEDPKIWAVQMRVVEWLHPVVYGPLVQRHQIDQRILTQNVDLTDIKQLDSQLGSVQKQIESSQREDSIVEIKKAELIPAE